MTEIKKYFKFDNVDQEKRIVKGLIYPANRKDSDGEYMSPATIEKMRERFMRLNAQGKASIDLLHNGIAGTGFITGSYIEKSGDWVGEVKIEDDSTWELIKSGVLKGFSIYGKSIMKSEDGEILDPQIDKISIVESPSHGETFSVIKEDKSIIKKAIEYMNNLIKEDRTMDNNIETRLTTLEKSMTEINDKLTTLTKSKTETTNESNPLEQRLNKMEEIQKSINEQVELLTGGISQSQKEVKKEEKKEEDLYSIFA